MSPAYRASIFRSSVSLAYAPCGQRQNLFFANAEPLLWILGTSAKCAYEHPPDSRMIANSASQSAGDKMPADERSKLFYKSVCLVLVPK